MVDFTILLMMALIGLCSASNKPACTDKGGECIKHGSDCGGEVLSGKKYCTSKREFCCVPIVPNDPKGCPVWLDGYFYYAPSSQCFYFPNTVANYAGGQAICEENGMTMAHPYDSIGLRRYMVEKWYKAEPFIGAKKSGDNFYWTDNGLPVPSSYWYPDHPLDGDDCMILLAWDLRMGLYPEQPLYSRPCSMQYSTLCEWKP